MKKIIVANWKMSPDSLKEAEKIFNEIKRAAGKMLKVEIVICTPFIYLSTFYSPHSALKLGSQDVFYEEKGAYTGEISAKMLKNLGASYVIIGHSERRKHFGETNEIINKKIKIALKNNLKVIFCVGEEKRNEEAGHLRFIKDELEKGLKGIPRKSMKNLVIAYEPIWAIGKTGKSADKPENILQMSIYIRRILLEIAGKELSRAIPILYGGSVEPGNAEDILKNGGAQGFLVGHASLAPKQFNKILKTADETSKR